MRALAERPWAREVLLFLGAYVLYSLGRFVAVGDAGVATGNAQSIDHLEAAIGVDVESGVQRAFDGTAALWLLNHLYALGRAAVRLRGSGLHAELEPAHVPVPAT